MAINWTAVKAKLDAKAQQARSATNVNDAMNIYHGGIIEALQELVATAQVDGLAVVNGGTAAPNGPVTGANVTNAKIT